MKFLGHLIIFFISLAIASPIFSYIDYSLHGECQKFPPPNCTTIGKPHDINICLPNNMCVYRWQKSVGSFGAPLFGFIALVLTIPYIIFRKDKYTIVRYSLAGGIIGVAVYFIFIFSLLNATGVFNRINPSLSANRVGDMFLFEVIVSITTFFGLLIGIVKNNK